MKTVTLPQSDCESASAGEIGPDSFHNPFGKPPPKYGVIIWYQDKALAKAAAEAVFANLYKD